MKYKDRRLRHEIKYIITPGVYEILRSRFRAVMKPDENAAYQNGGGAYPEYRVTSLYFDDIYRSSYNDKMLGLISRRKFRIRSYNLSDKKITLEAKYKDADYVSKLNTPLTRGEYNLILKGGLSLGYTERFHSTSFEEMAISNSISALRPSVLVDYFREPYINREGNVRFTFDKNLSTCYETCDIFKEGIVFSPVLSNNVILEIKYDDYIPSYLEELISGFPLSRESVSKFILCTDKLLEVKNNVFCF